MTETQKVAEQIADRISSHTQFVADEDAQVNADGTITFLIHSQFSGNYRITVEPVSA
jgi:hypothetical protein